MNDWELLRSWAEQHSEPAFTELVRRHLNLVYGSAVRQLGQSDLAQDVCQAVFLVLARKAGRLGVMSSFPAGCPHHFAAGRARDYAVNAVNSSTI
jgi:DNA-directed RNA polymerase specialized sigma24 family protein